jgi:hypothetical protein
MSDEGTSTQPPRAVTEAGTSPVKADYVKPQLTIVPMNEARSSAVPSSGNDLTFGYS